MLTWIHKPMNLLLPGSDGIWTDSSQTQHWIGKDIAFCCCELNCKVVLCHICCCQSIAGILVISVWSLISIPVSWNNSFNDFMGWFLVERKFSEKSLKMNCSLKRDGHKYSPYSLIHIEMIHFVSRTETISLSHVRENLLKMRDVGSRCLEIVWPNFASTFAVWVSRRYEFPRTVVQNASFCRTGELDAASWWCSLATRLPVLLQSDWQGALSISGLFDAIGLCSVEELVAAWEARFNVGFDFATILSSPFSSCILFAIVSGQLVELTFWEQQTELK